MPTGHICRCSRCNSAHYLTWSSRKICVTIFLLIDHKPHRWIAEQLIEAFPELVRPHDDKQEIIDAKAKRVTELASRHDDGWPLAVKIGREKKAELQSYAESHVFIGNRDTRLQRLEKLWEKFEERPPEKAEIIDGKAVTIYKDQTYIGLKIIMAAEAICNEGNAPNIGRFPSNEDAILDDEDEFATLCDMELSDSDTF